MAGKRRKEDGTDDEDYEDGTGDEDNPEVEDEKNPEVEDENRQKTNGKTNKGSHCEPNSVLMAAAALSSDAKSVVRDCVVLSKDKQIDVTPEFVKRCFAIPDGEKSIEDRNWSEQYRKFWNVLKDEGYNVVYKHVGMCSYIDEMKSYNWCKYLCHDLKTKITAWKGRPKKPSKIEGCSLLLLICLLENMEPEDTPEDTPYLVGPLINHYDDKKTEKLVKGMKGTLNSPQEVTKYKVNIVKKPASGKQKVPQGTGKGKQPPSKNLQVSKQIIEIPSLQHLLKESEVEKDEEGILLIEMNSYQAKFMEELEKLKDPA
ncbi:hypothetical protein ACP4OV_000235 [Aristida adscensionis]